MIELQQDVCSSCEQVTGVRFFPHEDVWHCEDCQAEDPDTYTELLVKGGERLAPIVELWHLSTNYEHPTPYVKFLDLIGYSEENFGTTLHDGPTLGHLELSYVAEALQCWVVRPTDVENMIDTIERLAD